VIHLVYELLSDVDIEVGHEPEASALPANGVPYDLRLLYLTVLLEMAHEVLVRQAVVEPTNEDLFSHTLRKLLFLGLGGAPRAVTRPTASATIIAATVFNTIATYSIRGTTITIATSTLIIIGVA